MNPLRCLAQFIVFLHNRSWTSKTSLIDQFLHFTLMFGLFFVASAIYLHYFQVYTLPIKEITAVLILIPSVLVICVFLLLLGKRPYLKPEFKNWQVVAGVIIWVLLWIYILPAFNLLKDWEQRLLKMCSGFCIFRTNRFRLMIMCLRIIVASIVLIGVCWLIYLILYPYFTSAIC